jgi:flagellar basal body-associated protein FliL
MAKQAAATAEHGSGEGAKKAGGMSGKLKIAGIILGVIILEWLVAYMYLPGSSHTADAETATAEAAHEDSHSGEHGGHGKAAKDAGHRGDQEEIDLGEFTVTAYQPVSNSTLFISFHLYGSILHKHSEDLNRRLADNKFRIRDNVIVIIRSAEIADLTDAGLGLIKRRILETTNKTLGKPLLQAVMFSDFSFVEQ